MKFFYLEKSDVSLGVDDTAIRMPIITVYKGKVEGDVFADRIFTVMLSKQGLYVSRKYKGDVPPPLLRATTNAILHLVEHRKIDFFYAD